MLQALSAATSALDLLKSLTAAKSPSSANKHESKSPFDLSASTEASGNAATTSPVAGGGSQISPATMTALLAAQSEANAGSSRSVSAGRSDALKDMFAQIDADSDGKLSQSEFANALGAGGTNLAQADRVFGKLDKNGDGSVSLEEMMSALKGKAHRRDDDRESDTVNAVGRSRKDPVTEAAQAASSTSVTNSDGSVTTSLTYADGTKVTMTSAAAGSGAATSSYNFIDRMIQQQAQAASSASAGSLSIST